MQVHIFALLSYALILLNLIDTCMTTFLLDHWIFTEANPIMLVLLMEYPIITLVWKILIVNIMIVATVPIYAHIPPQRRRPYSALMCIAVLVYGILVMWEFYLVWYAAPLLF